ncbi:gluconate 2-dehydrogenase subunit 3 family protein [Mariniflexile sp.]|uniref:gluconate 2-dehydrogenase subunit 3 family protein n=1 Tax=Mariniflexile sp. TaxID=1979402 RepID=UPI00404831A7
MKRRSVLKGLGLSLGYAVATPSVLSLFQSCKTEPEVWVPQLLSFEEGVLVKNLIDIMLPKTEDTPGALDVNVPEFLDLFASKVYNQEQTSEFLNGISCIMEELPITDLGVSALKKEDYQGLLNHYLRIKKEQREIYLEEENTVFIALTNLRDFAVWAYKTSEHIGKNILVYDPIPGRQQGCVSLEEATGGRAWSL